MAPHWVPSARPLSPTRNTHITGGQDNPLSAIFILLPDPWAHHLQGTRAPASWFPHPTRLRGSPPPPNPYLSPRWGASRSFIPLRGPSTSVLVYRCCLGNLHRVVRCLPRISCVLEHHQNFHFYKTCVLSISKASLYPGPHGYTSCIGIYKSYMEKCIVSSLKKKKNFHFNILTHLS